MPNNRLGSLPSVAPGYSRETNNRRQTPNKATLSRKPAIPKSANESVYDAASRTNKVVGEQFVMAKNANIRNRA